MNPRNVTLLEKMGFKDDDLKNPTHDKIILHLLNPKNMLTMLNTLGFNPTKINDIKTEIPHTSSSGYILGYIDLEIHYYKIESYVYRGVNTSDESLFFCYAEIKTRIDSFGEVMRQLRTYDCERNKFILVTAGKNPYKKEFESQRISCYELDV